MPKFQDNHPRNSWKEGLAIGVQRWSGTTLNESDPGIDAYEFVYPLSQVFGDARPYDPDVSGQ